MTAAIEEGEKPEIIHRVYKGTIDDVDTSKRCINSIVTTDAIDRYREVIIPKGIQLENFQANPVVLWCHDSGIVIGKCLWIKRKGNGLIARTLFAKTDKAEEIFRLYVDGFLNGWSIGARPDWGTYSPPTPEEVKARPELKNCQGIIRRCELLEYSAVSIPANPEALGNEVAKSISRGLLADIERGGSWQKAPEWLAEAGDAWTIAAEEASAPDPRPEPVKKTLPPLIGKTFAEVREDVRRGVRLMTGEAAAKRSVAEAIDRLKGRV